MTRNEPTPAPIVAMPPGVQAVIDEASRIHRPGWQDYERLKRRIDQLVGWNATNPRFADSRARDAAIRQLLDSLGL